MVRRLTLRIKKKYFDLIRDGSKRSEMREMKPYYEKIFSKKYDELHLHYQKTARLKARITTVRRRKTPMKLMHLLKTKQIFEIHLDRIEYYEV